MSMNKLGYKSLKMTIWALFSKEQKGEMTE